MNYKPDPRIKTYLEFNLPSINQIDIIAQEITSQNRQYLSDCRRKSCKECADTELTINSKEVSSRTFELFNSFVRPTDVDCMNSTIFEVHNLYGNVSEWLIEPQQTYGGGWNDSSSKIGTVNPTSIDKSASIGFRNICKVVEVDNTIQEAGNWPG